jgi:hypothetical protein
MESKSGTEFEIPNFVRNEGIFRGGWISVEGLDGEGGGEGEGEGVRA